MVCAGDCAHAASTIQKSTIRRPDLPRQDAAKMAPLSPIRGSVR